MNHLSLDYRYLKAFLVTAKFLNFSKASDELGIAQSAVSRQIKLLEESIGHQLLVRSSKKVALTKMGEELIDQLTQFEENIKELFHPESSKLIRIGILHGLLETWFTDITQEMSRKFPYQFSIEINTLENLKTNLKSGKYDFIFTSENIQSEFVNSLQLFEEKMVLISKKNLSLNSLYEYPWIAYSAQDHLFQINKKRSDQIIIINSITAMIKLVKKGVGIAIVPEHTIEAKEQLKIYEMSNLSQSYIYLSSLNYKKTPDYIKQIFEFLKQSSSHK
jgi:DNA-binding transcriptional LysR family regulator